jgi:hypothetical protein
MPELFMLIGTAAVALFGFTRWWEERPIKRR